MTKKYSDKELLEFLSEAPDIKSRLSKHPPYEIILYLEFGTLKEALKLEKLWLSNVEHLKFIPDNFPKEGRGKTECFINLND